MAGRGAARARRSPARTRRRLLARLADAHERSELLAGSGHGYFSYLPFAVALCVALLVAGLAAVIRAAGHGRPAYSLDPWPLALLPIATFVLQEHLERYLHDGAFPWHAVAGPHSCWASCSRSRSRPPRSRSHGCSFAPPRQSARRACPRESFGLPCSEISRRRRSTSLHSSRLRGTSRTRSPAPPSGLIPGRARRGQPEGEDDSRVTAEAGTAARRRPRGSAHRTCRGGASAGARRPHRDTACQRHRPPDVAGPRAAALQRARGRESGRPARLRLRREPRRFGPDLSSGCADRRDRADDRPLARGTYTVAWRIVSADSHPLHGAFVFSVKSKSDTSGVIAQLLEEDEVPREVSVGFTVTRF